MENIVQADEYMALATSKLNSFSLFFRQSRRLEAALLFEKAASFYASSHSWEAAAKARMHAAEIHHKLGDLMNAASAYVDASHCYAKISTTEAIRVLRIAIPLRVELSQLTFAANLFKELAVLFEGVHELVSASAEYENASKYFYSADRRSSAIECLAKVGELKAKLQDFGSAIRVFEEVAITSLASKTISSQPIRRYFFLAALCHFCENARLLHSIDCGIDILDRYCSIFTHFSQTREYELLNQLIVHYSTDDDQFSLAIDQYSCVCRLSSLAVSLLLFIQKTR